MKFKRLMILLLVGLGGGLAADTAVETYRNQLLREFRGMQHDMLNQKQQVIRMRNDKTLSAADRQKAEATLARIEHNIPVTIRVVDLMHRAQNEAQLVGAIDVYAMQHK